MMSDASSLQRIASDPSTSVWVAASAGSGKTKVLTDRVLRLLLADAAPSRILCITYTKAAAAEMQNRLHKRLGEWVLMEEAALMEQLEALTGHPPAQEQVRKARRLFARLLEDTPGLRIQTFHSFCQSLLARFPLEAGVAPHFTLIDDQDAKDLLQEARIRLLQTGLSGEDKRLKAVIEELSAASGESSFTELMAEIIAKRRVIERILAQPGRAVAHNTRVYAALGMPCYGVSAEAITREILPMDEVFCQRLRLTIDVLETGTKQDNNLAENLRAAVQTRHVEHVISALLTKEGTPRKSLMTNKLAGAFPHHLEFLQQLAGRCVTLQDRLSALNLAQLTDAVAILAESLFALYSAMKRGRGYLDYDDLILKTRQLLRGEGMAAWVLYKIDGGIDHLLIDEAQDTSPEQWEMKAALEDEFFAGKTARPPGRTLFVVGDEKQSIYRFQGADPQGFGEQKARSQEKISQSGEAFSVVPMNTSFRSAPLVLSLVDTVFAGELAQQGMAGEVHHVAHRSTAGGRVELWPLLGWEGNSQTEDDNWPLPDAQKAAFSPMMRLAEKIATTIAGWMKEQRPLMNAQRPVRAGDIMVLVRSRTDFIGYLSRTLKERGVPVAGLDRMKITEHLAVRDLMALAQFLLLPEDDYTLACLLKSPLYSLSESQLFTLCYERGKATLWERVRAYQGTDAECLAAREELQALLAQADYDSPHHLFAHLLYARGGRKRFMARMGAEVEEVLDMFMELTLDYGQHHTPSLQGLLLWLTHGTGDIKRDMEQGVDAVRIMTIHGAKGLEAPIVFLPDTTRLSQNKERILIHEDSPYPCLLFCPNQEADSALSRDLKEKRKAADDAEAHRLLYVAMTRARDELYVAGYLPKSESIKDECWYRLIEHGFGRMEGADPHEDGGWSVEQAGVAESKEAASTLKEQIPPLPDFAHVLPALEPALAALQPATHLDEAAADAGQSSPTPRTLVASAGRGILIHRLLHLLSALPTDKRALAANRYLALHAANMGEGERQQIAAEVLDVMQHPEFAEVFSPEALAEAPIVGVVEGKRLAGQVDRLRVTKDAVLVVDFKTAPPPQDARIPAVYAKQMYIYQKLLEGVYPDCPVRCALLYTAQPLLIPLAQVASETPCS